MSPNLHSYLSSDKGLSATTVTRLKGLWEQEYHDWSKRSLAGKQYVYVWADGACLLGGNDPSQRGRNRWPGN